jgi:hypothetical protein
MRCASDTDSDSRSRSWRAGGTARIAGATLAVALVSMPAPAAAGPWARGAGDVFLSFTFTAEDSLNDIWTYGQLEPERTQSAYGEVGLGRRLTAGIELDWGEVSQMSVVFLRWTFTPPETRWQVALDAGIGRRAVEGQPVDSLTRIGGSLGYGFGAWALDAGELSIGHQGGWISIDAKALLRSEEEDPILQSEATLGLNLEERWRGILAIKAEKWPGAEPVVTARPSVVFELREGTAVQAGVHGALYGSETVGASLSLWQEF